MIKVHVHVHVHIHGILAFQSKGYWLCRDRIPRQERYIVFQPSSGGSRGGSCPLLICDNFAVHYQNYPCRI